MASVVLKRKRAKSYANKPKMRKKTKIQRTLKVQKTSVKQPNYNLNSHLTSLNNRKTTNLRLYKSAKPPKR